MLFAIISSLPGGRFGGLKALLVGAAIGWLGDRAVQRWLIDQLNVIHSQLLGSTSTSSAPRGAGDGPCQADAVVLSRRIVQESAAGQDALPGNDAFDGSIPDNELKI